MPESELRFQLSHVNAHVPVRATAGSAGYDIVAVEAVCILPGEQMKVRSGLRMQLPINTYAKLEIILQYGYGESTRSRGCYRPRL